MQFVEEFGQHRVVEVYRTRVPIETDAEARLNQPEHRSTRPGLRYARHRIECRRVEPAPRKAAEQFGQPPQIHISRCFEQPPEDFEHLVLQAVACKTQSDYF